MLKDITNRKYSYSTPYRCHFNNTGIRNTVTDSNPPQRPGIYKNKLAFGDETSIELVKNRQRKILNDINRLNDAISEINKSIAQLDTIEIVNLTRQKTEMNEEIETVSKEIDLLDDRIQSIDDEIIKLEQMDKMYIANETLRYKIESQDLFNVLDLKLINQRTSLKNEMDQILNDFKPSSDLLEDIQNCNERIKMYKSELNELKLQNRRKVNSMENDTLIPTLREFKSERDNKLNDLITQNNKMRSSLDEMKQNQEKYNKDIEDINSKILNDKGQIEILEKEISKLTIDVAPPLIVQSQDLNHRLDESTSELEKIQRRYRSLRDQYIVESKKLDQERRRNKTLKDAIHKTLTTP